MNFKVKLIGVFAAIAMAGADFTRTCPRYRQAAGIVPVDSDFPARARWKRVC
jgi:hypothetical protein